MVERQAKGAGYRGPAIAVDENNEYNAYVAFGVDMEDHGILLIQWRPESTREKE